jgi:SET domain-containing protein
MLDGRFGGSGAEFVNHSCDPNLVWKRVHGHLVFYSRRKIRAGEELTLWYTYPVKITRIPCGCGSPKCRGTLRYLLRGTPRSKSPSARIGGNFKNSSVTD